MQSALAAGRDARQGHDVTAELAAWILSFRGNPVGPGGEDGGERVVMEGSQEVVCGRGWRTPDEGQEGFLGV